MIVTPVLFPDMYTRTRKSTSYDRVIMSCRQHPLRSGSFAATLAASSLSNQVSVCCYGDCIVCASLLIGKTKCALYVSWFVVRNLSL